MKKPTHKIYRTTNWPAYNRALMSRGNIAIWFDPATQWYAPSKGKQGRNQTYSDAAIQCCLMIKSLFRLSLRMVTGFVQSLIKLCGLNWIAPDYTTLCRRQKHIDIVISYQKSSDGLHLLMDSTGMKFLGEGEWKRKKHGPEYRRQWRKLHIGIDAKTLQIRAVQLTTNNVTNSPSWLLSFLDLYRQLRQHIKLVQFPINLHLLELHRHNHHQQGNTPQSCHWRSSLSFAVLYTKFPSPHNNDHNAHKLNIAMEFQLVIEPLFL